MQHSKGLCLKNKNHQIFLSATRAQVMTFKTYIKQFAKDLFDWTLVGGDVVELSKWLGVAILVHFEPKCSRVFREFVG